MTRRTGYVAKPITAEERKIMAEVNILYPLIEENKKLTNELEHEERLNRLSDLMARSGFIPAGFKVRGMFEAHCIMQNAMARFATV